MVVKKYRTDKGLLELVVVEGKNRYYLNNTIIESYTEVVELLEHASEVSDEKEKE